MEKIIAYCGLDCGICPAYVATINDDNDARAKVAEQWGKEFGMEIKPEDVNCDGCLSKDGRKIGYCNVCEIRQCGVAKAVENCAHCEDYSCEKITAFHAQAAAAKETLDAVRNSL